MSQSGRSPAVESDSERDQLHDDDEPDAGGPFAERPECSGDHSSCGAAFSLLPPQNATGNYVKVVQRVPVKIVFDTPPDVYVGPGMSVVPTVKVQ